MLKGLSDSISIVRHRYSWMKPLTNLRVRPFTRSSRARYVPRYVPTPYGGVPAQAALPCPEWGDQRTERPRTGV